MIKDLLEKLELVCPSDPEMQLGDTYFAETEKDIFDGLDKLIPGDALGIYLKHKEIDETQELTLEMLDEDKYKMYIEKDTEENSNDWEGKNVLDTNPIDKNQVIETLNGLLQDYKVIANKNESVLPDRLVEAKIDHLIDRDGDWYLMQINTKPVLFCLRNSFDGNKVEILQNKKSEWIITFNDKQEASFKRNNLDGIIDFINNNYPIELPLDVLEELVDLQEEELNESLAGYKTVAKIIQNKNGFNVAEEDEPMLNEDQPTLKTLLTKLAKYL